MKHAQGDPQELRKKFWVALADSPYLFLERTGESTTAVPMSPQLDKDAEAELSNAVGAFKKSFA